MPRVKKTKTEPAKKKPTIKAVPDIKQSETTKETLPKEEENILDEVISESDWEKQIRAKPERYFEATGRRKTSVARVRLFTRGEKVFLVNEKPFNNYFQSFELQQIVKSALEKMKCLDKFRIIVKVSGGGIHSQAEAVRHGISRALVEFNLDFKKRLKRAGFLTRDSRMRERKKFGLKRARKAPQWAKR